MIRPKSCRLPLAGTVENRRLYDFVYTYLYGPIVRPLMRHDGVRYDAFDQVAQDQIPFLGFCRGKRHATTPYLAFSGERPPNMSQWQPNTPQVTQYYELLSSCLSAGPPKRLRRVEIARLVMNDFLFGLVLTQNK